MSSRSELLARAYAVCAGLARSHAENFPVASWLLPSAMRPHIAAVYAYARVADDLADEGTLSAAERQARLGAWQQRLHDRVADGAHDREAAEYGDDDFVILALSHSIRELELPLPLFDDLLSAFSQDTTTTRYESWDHVLDYCRRSANPVGRLVLRIAGYRSERLDRSSDALCTALQLTNFWQDFGRDWRAGRLYVPKSVLETCGASEAELAGLQGELSIAWGHAIAGCCAFTRAKFDEGCEVCQAVHGRLRYELRLTWTGGRRILDRVERRRADLLTWRPALGVGDLPHILWGVARWGVAV